MASGVAARATALAGSKPNAGAWRATNVAERQPAHTAAPGWRSVPPLAVAIAAGLGVVGLVEALVRPLLVLVLAITLASALAPAVARLERPLSRPAAIAAVYITLLALLAAFAWYAAPTVVQQGQELREQLPALLSALEARLEAMLPEGVRLQEMLRATAETLASRSASWLSSFATGAVELLVIVFLSAYFLAAGPRFHRFALQLAVNTNRRRTSRILSRMSHAMGGYFRGAAIDGLIIGVLTWIALLLIGRPFAAPLAVLAGVGELVPYIGPLAAAIPAVGLALLDSPQQAVIVGLAYVAIQQVEGHVVTPLVMHTQTSISPGTVLFAVSVGWTVAGVLGAVAAVPLFAAARVLLVWVVSARARCWERRRS